MTVLKLNSGLSPEEATHTAVLCESITFGYSSENPIIFDFDLRVQEGKILCILGASGCGKTSLLNLIAGFVRQQAGYIFANGKEVTGPGPDRGVVFQEYSLFPWLTTLKNVEFGLKHLSRAERRTLAIEQLSRVGLTSSLDRYPFQLSGGMKQRAAIARTLATKPRVLLMDEPFAALDALTRTSLQDELVSIHNKTQTTIIFVTHNVAEAITLGDRAIVLGPGGAIIDDINVGRPKRGTSEYANSYERLATALNVRQAE